MDKGSSHNCFVTIIQKEFLQIGRKKVNSPEAKQEQLFPRGGGQGEPAAVGGVHHCRKAERAQRGGPAERPGGVAGWDVAGRCQVWAVQLAAPSGRVASADGVQVWFF